MAPGTASEQIVNVRQRILEKVKEKYPNRPEDFINRKVAKQVANIFPGEGIPAANGSIQMGNGTSNTSTSTHLPQHSDKKTLPHAGRRSLPAGDKGILVGFYKISDVQDDKDKHAVVGKIDKGGNLFTTVTNKTRRGGPAPSTQYLASKVQCSSEKITFEPHLVGLNKQQLKEYVLRRLDADPFQNSETPEEREASELQIAADARNDKSLIRPETRKQQPTVLTGTKRGYSAFADDNEDDDEDEEESPLSEIGETSFPDTDDEDAFVPAGGSRNRSAGRKSIGARTSMGDNKETDGDDIGKGVPIGVWAGSPAVENKDKHGVYSYLDAHNSLRSRVFHVTRDGKHIDSPIPFIRGTIKWDNIILDHLAHLSQMDREEVKAYVIDQRKKQVDDASADDLPKEVRGGGRKPNAEQTIKEEPYSGFVLLGHWKLGAADNVADKNAVYGYVGLSSRFNLQVRKHTRDGREITTNPHFPGNGKVQKDHMILEPYLSHLNHAQIQAYTRKALKEGIPDLSGPELRAAELRIAKEVALEEMPDIARDKVQEEPRVKRKYVRRQTINPVDETPDEVPAMRPGSRMGGANAPAPPNHNQGFIPAQPPYASQQPNGVPGMAFAPGVAFGPNGSLIWNNTEFSPRAPPQPPIMDDNGTTIMNDGLKYVQNTGGVFEGKFVHSEGQLISVNSVDYAVYRVLVKTDI